MDEFEEMRKKRNWRMVRIYSYHQTNKSNYKYKTEFVENPILKRNSMDAINKICYTYNTLIP